MYFRENYINLRLSERVPGKVTHIFCSLGSLVGLWGQTDQPEDDITPFPGKIPQCVSFPKFFQYSESTPANTNRNAKPNMLT